MSQFYSEASEQFNQAQNNPFSPPEDSKQMSPPVQKGEKLRSTKISERGAIRDVK